MSNPGSVTRWIRTLRQGDEDAAAHLWERYFRRLAGIARAQLGQARQAAADGDDVALSAFHSFCRCIEEGRLTDLRDRVELWRVLVVITKRKAISWLRRETAAVRGAGKVKGDAFLADAATPDPTPESTVEMLDELRHLVEILRREDGTLCLIALRKSEGYSNKEIAAELSLAPRSVERKFQRICILWDADLQQRFGDPRE